MWQPRVDSSVSLMERAADEAAHGLVGLPSEDSPVNRRKFRGWPWLFASTFALVIGSFPAAKLAATETLCPVRSSDVLQSITLDDVDLSISGQALPDSQFYVAPRGAATQIATATTYHPYCGIEIVAIP